MIQDAADGILDGMILDGYRPEMKGEPERKLRSPLSISDTLKGHR